VNHATARAISILGHPILVLSVALLALSGMHRDPMRLAMLCAGLLVAATSVMAYSHHQVRRGRWAHVDASHARERWRLNVVLLPVFAIGALLAWMFSADNTIILALALSAAIILMAMASTRACRLSLHMAFAVFSALLLVRAAFWSGIAMFAFALLVGGSRRVLARHDMRDLVAGALAGVAAGATFLFSTQAWRS
jgi:uncharacterized membrane protein